MNQQETKPEEKKEQEKPKAQKVGIPTQKTFSFNTLFNSQNKIDSTVNKWLKEQALKQQTPFLGKAAVSPGIFGGKIVYVFMFSTFIEIEKK